MEIVEGYFGDIFHCDGHNGAVLCWPTLRVPTVLMIDR